MSEPHLADELDGLRRFLARLTSNELTLRRGLADVTQDEIGVLRREIAHLERVLARGTVDGPGV